MKFGIICFLGDKKESALAFFQKRHLDGCVNCTILPLLKYDYKLSTNYVGRESSTKWCEQMTQSTYLAIQGCRIPGSGGAQAPPVFRTLSHKNAIKPENLRF